MKFKTIIMVLIFLIILIGCDAQNGSIDMESKDLAKDSMDETKVFMYDEEAQEAIDQLEPGNLSLIDALKVDTSLIVKFDELIPELGNHDLLMGLASGTQTITRVYALADGGILKVISNGYNGIELTIYAVYDDALVVFESDAGLMEYYMEKENCTSCIYMDDITDSISEND